MSSDYCRFGPQKKQPRGYRIRPMSTEKALFSERFRQALSASRYADYSNEKFGGVLGVTKQAISQWKRGDAIPGIATAIELAKALDVSIDWLLTGRGPMRVIESKMDPNTQLLVVAFENLSHEAKKEVLGYMAYVLERMGDKTRREKEEELKNDISRIVSLSRSGK